MLIQRGGYEHRNLFRYFVYDEFCNTSFLFLMRRRFSLPVRESRVWIATALGTTVYIMLFWAAVDSHLLGIELAAMIGSVLTFTFILLPGRKRYLWKKVILYGFLCSFVISGVISRDFNQLQIFLRGAPKFDVKCSVKSTKRMKTAFHCTKGCSMLIFF